MGFEPSPPRASTRERVPTTSQLDTTLAAHMVRIGKGDQQAFASLYDATVHRVFAVAMRVVNDPETAEEIVSDVYFQAWRDAQHYDPARGLVLTWLMMMCRSRALDALRRHDCAVVHPNPWELADDPAHDAADPQDIVSTLEGDRAIRAKLALLDAPTRQLIALAFFRDHSHAEIAAETGLPLGTVKTRIRQALLTLRAGWDQR